MARRVACCGIWQQPAAGQGEGEMLTWAFNRRSTIVRAAEVRALPHAQRPICICPSCRRELIPALSPRSNAFFRHQAENDPCYATAPEGALHLEAKRLLREHLMKVAADTLPLEVAYRCNNCQRPMVALAPGLCPGDVVREEEWLDPLKTRKPDLTVWRGSTRFLLAELVATNPCGEEKWGELRATGLPVIELLAQVVAGGEGHAPWQPGRPLPIERALGFSRPSVCASCEEERRRDAERNRLEAQRKEARAAQADEEKKQRFNTRYEHVQHIWFVDFHHPNGTRRRRRLIASLVEYQGMWTGRLLDTEGKVVKSWAPTPEPDSQFPLHAEQTLRELLGKTPASVIASVSHRLDGPDVDSEQEALELDDPIPNLWWAIHERRWIAGYTPRFLHRKFPRACRLDEWMWMKSGAIPVVEVQAEAGRGRHSQLIEKTLADEFLAYAKGAGPRPARLESLPPEVKRKLEEIEQNYRRKKERTQAEAQKAWEQAMLQNVFAKK
jgi:hypothetical protein